MVLIPGATLLYLYLKSPQQPEEIKLEETSSTITKTTISNASDIDESTKQVVTQENKSQLTVTFNEPGFAYVNRLNEEGTGYIGESERFYENFSITLDPGVYNIYAQANDLTRAPIFQTLVIDPLIETKFEIIFEDGGGGAIQQADDELDQTTAEEEAAFKKYQEANPLAKYLPYQTERYEIWLPDNETYVYRIDIYPLVLFEENEDQFKAEIDKYKQEINDWITDKGVDPKSLKISYRIMKVEQ